MSRHSSLEGHQPIPNLRGICDVLCTDVYIYSLTQSHYTYIGRRIVPLNLYIITSLS